MNLRAFFGGLVSLSIVLPAWGGDVAEPETGIAESAVTAAAIAIAGTGRLQGSVPLYASLDLRPTTVKCSNTGPDIELEGVLSIRGIKTEVILRNNLKGTHETSAQVDATVEVLADGHEIVIPKQPSRGGVGGNPHIWLQFESDKGKPLGQPKYLGRCVQGLKAAHLDFEMLSRLDADIVTGDCSNSPGPYITLSGAFGLAGINAKLIFTNNAKWTHVAAEDVCVDLLVLKPGEKLVFHKSPAMGGAGGNPHVFLRFFDHKGGALCDEISLGRCKQMGW
jgi:hypothetical protein